MKERLGASMERKEDRRYIIGKNVNFTPIGLGSVGEAMKFQARIINGMEKKEFFTPLEPKEFIGPIKGRGGVYFLRHKHEDKDELIGLAVGACDIPGTLAEYNLPDDLPDDKVMLIDSVMVAKGYRGHGLQLQILAKLEEEAKKLGLNGLVATVHPENQYSLVNFEKAGYRVLHEANLHGGRRFVVMKEISSEQSLA